MSPFYVALGFIAVVAICIVVFCVLPFNAAQTKLWQEKRDCEMRRVAAAFGVKEPKIHAILVGWYGEGVVSEFDVHWISNENWGKLLECDLKLHRVSIELKCLDGSVVDNTWIDYNKYTQRLEITTAGILTCELMKRGLYCLGFEDEEVFTQLNCSLTAHERLELRLSLPHEFWPQKWLDEANNKHTKTL